MKTFLYLDINSLLRTYKPYARHLPHSNVHSNFAKGRGSKIINVNDDNNTNIYKATFLYEV